MKLAHKLGATGVIVHLGAEAVDIKTVLAVLDKLENKMNNNVLKSVILWLEVNAIKAEVAVFDKTEHIKKLFWDIGKKRRGLRVGFCIDTAHLWSCGTVVASYEQAEKWFSDLPKDVPLMLHLNDSESELGSGNDKHGALTLGNIWKDYSELGTEPFSKCGLSYIFQWIMDNDIDCILERHPSFIEHDLILMSKYLIKK
jgi:endonuclease IV